MERITCCLYIFFVMFMFVYCQPPTEQRLHNFLLKDYNKLIRPSGVNGSKLTVKLGMRLSQILDIFGDGHVGNEAACGTREMELVPFGMFSQVYYSTTTEYNNFGVFLQSEKNQILTSNVWLIHEWTDNRLRWNMQEYEDLEKTHIPVEDLWRPDILLYNNADGSFVVTVLTKATVFHNGLISWEPPAIYKSYCPINVEFFPFDQQECFMKFSSWTYDGIQLDLRHVWENRSIPRNNEKVIPLGVDLCEYYPSAEWDIVNVTARWAEKFYPCCPEPWPDIMFNITIRRRTLFYTINLIMPCVAISCLTILVFYLPSDSGEKITLSISIVIALTVYFLLLAEINPPTSITIPLIGKYLLFTMLVVILSIFLTVYTLSIHFRSPSTHHMSPWVKRVFIEIMPKLLFIKRPEYDMKKKKKPKKAKKSLPEVPNDATAEELSRVIQASVNNQPNYENLRRRGVSEPVDDLPQYPMEIRESLKGVKFIAEHLRNEDDENLVCNDWHYVAIVMDRLFLWVFTIACLCGTLGIFMTAPTLYEPTIPLHFNCTD